ncbi:hypothetical protein [Campylobacter ureolyticus]|uniref:hypothetical protein n=2 Tax=Campylobacter ureolyticus TaxID=827 RepID=UPI002906D164|nr:hypothetical protein [Campylobacter ureolyticus]MDU5326222.1 hypothetical protein [Campylobacter ureolyticus]
MSDEKREKLREYLRNNRPKNGVNLGNNSDNKEKSNKNLEDDLNLDNSQILNNKINFRDYDKEPLILQDYNGWGFAMFSLLTIFYWFISLCYIFDKINNYYLMRESEYNYFDFNYAMRCALLFGLVTIVLFFISYLCIYITKRRYTHFYLSKAIFYNHRHKIINIIFFENYEDRIILSNTHNQIGEKYEKYLEKEEGKFTYGSFLHMITSEYFGLVFLGIFVFLSLFFIQSSFVINIFIIAFITFLTQFLEILVFMGIYKKSNKSLKNFYKYIMKFLIYIEWNSFDRWKPNPNIPMFFFNQKDHDDLKEYVLAVFHRDIDDNFKRVLF